MIRDDRYISNEKFRSRQELLIDTYRLTFNQLSISPDKQLISLCGDNSYNNCLHPQSEISHFVSDDLLQPEQYIGVDSNWDIVVRNKRVAPTIRYYHGEIQDVFDRPLLSLNPEVIFFDTNRMGKTQHSVVEPFSKVLLEVAKRYPHQVLMVFNWMGRGYKQSVTPEQSFHALWKSPTFQEAMRSAKWHVCPEYYGYKNGAVGMFGFWFLKADADAEVAPSVIHIETVQGMTLGGSISPFDEETQSLISRINNKESDMAAQSSEQTNLSKAVNHMSRIKNELEAVEQILSGMISSNGSSNTATKTKHPPKAMSVKALSKTKQKDPERVAAGLKAAETLRKKREAQRQKHVEAGKKAAQTRKKNQKNNK